MSSRPDADRIAVARFGAAHGIRGEVRLKTYTADPLAVRSYCPLEAGDGRAFTISAARPAAGTSPDMLVVRIDGVSTRDGAEALNGLELTVPRDRLPAAEEDEFYHADLIGLDATMTDGTTVGTIVAVQNFGAGDLLEIASPGRPTILAPFTREIVPEIDIVGGRVVIDPPPGLLGQIDEEDEEP